MAVDDSCGAIYAGDSHGQITKTQDGETSLTKKVTGRLNLGNPSELITATEILKHISGI